MNVRIGSAPDSWGVQFPSDPKQIPWQRYLDELVEAGYEWTELGPSGYLPTDVSTLRSELDRRGLKLAAGWLMPHLEDSSVWPELEKALMSLGNMLVNLDARFLVLIDDIYSDPYTGESRAPQTLDEEAWKRLIDVTNRVAQIARDRFGLKFAFHPHAETHVEYEEQIERFLEETDSELVKLCLDTGHHAYRGGDPVRFLRRHHRRISYFHFKSIDPKVQAKVEAEKIPFATAVEMEMFCEPAEGGVDFQALRDVLQEIDFDGWAIVEQDMYPAPFNKPLPIAKRTRAYLRKIGIG